MVRQVRPPRHCVKVRTGTSRMAWVPWRPGNERNSKKTFKEKTDTTQKEMELFFRNLRLVMMACKSYEDLCAVVRCIDSFLGQKDFEAVLNKGKSLGDISGFRGYIGRGR